LAAPFIWPKSLLAGRPSLGPFESRPIVIYLSSREAIAGRGSFIVLEAADEEIARGIAQKLARLTGRRVTVRDAQRSLIEAIPAAGIH
jgi:hypothetical protein